jgi:photosystem I subunit 2
MASLTARTQAPVASRAARSSVSRAAFSRPVRSVVVRAEAAEAPTKEAKPAWTQPTLNPDTPSPIFGGSTGGLLRKAQVGTAGDSSSTRQRPASRAWS